MNKQNQMKYHQMQAYWWVNAASNGHAKRREIYRGFGNVPLTDDEKVSDAMEIAQNHMRLFASLADQNTKMIDETGDEYGPKNG